MSNASSPYIRYIRASCLHAFSPDDYATVRKRAANDVCSNADLVHLWATVNHDALVRHAVAILKEEPVEWLHRIAPLKIVGFASEAEREAYRAQLFHECVRRHAEVCSGPQPSACDRGCYLPSQCSQILSLHIETFLVWACHELERQLDGLSQRVPYARPLLTPQTTAEVITAD